MRPDVLETIDVNRHELEALVRIKRAAAKQHAQLARETESPFIEGLNVGLSIADEVIANTLEAWLREHDDRAKDVA